MNAPVNVSQLRGDIPKKNTTTANDFESMVEQKKNELLTIAFRGLAASMNEAINDYIEEHKESIISSHLANDLFSTDQYSVNIETDYIAHLKDEFFNLLNENLKEYFDKTPEKETKQQIASTKSQLTDNKAGIQKIMQDVLNLLQENGWVTNATFDPRSGFLKSLTLSTPVPTTETVKKSTWQNIKEIFSF